MFVAQTEKTGEVSPVIEGLFAEIRRQRGLLAQALSEIKFAKGCEACAHYAEDGDYVRCHKCTGWEIGTMNIPTFAKFVRVHTACYDHNKDVRQCSGYDPCRYYGRNHCAHKSGSGECRLLVAVMNEAIKRKGCNCATRELVHHLFMAL